MELPGASEHYDKNYFDWQRDVGEFGAWANQRKFAEYIRPSDKVLDFGCGGGFLLNRIQCAEKFGVEPNEAAAQTACRFASKVFPSSADVPDDLVDLVISNNALEHTLQPLTELKNMRRALVPGGRIVIVVPCENISYAYAPNDPNYHLYSWSPMAMGNLLHEAGFSVVESKPYVHKWPARYRMWAKLGWPAFHAICRINGHLDRKWFQVRAVGIKAG